MSEVAELNETPAPYAAQTANLKRENYITSENAREMARRGNEAKKRLALEHAADIERLEKLAALAPKPPDVYVGEQVTETRAQIQRVQKLLRTAKDARKIKALSESLWRLSEVERVLSGRPLPSSAKPSRQPDRPASGAATPLD